MGLIQKEQALDRLELIKEECLAANKRVCAGTVQEAINSISSIKEIDLSGSKAVIETAEIVVSLEPFFKGGQIGRDVYRCGKCWGRVDRHDRFCKACGRKLIIKYESEENNP